MLKKIFAIVCCLVFSLTLTACGTGFGSLKYTEAPGSDIPSGTIIAQNSKYTLKLDKENMGIVLIDNATKQTWGSSPVDDSEPQYDEYGLLIEQHPKVKSILSVECKNFEEDEMNVYYSYIDAVESGKTTYYTVDNGIVIRYFFPEAQVMIPLECVLLEDGVKLSVNPQMIQEGSNRVTKVSIAPFFCSVKNDTENSYLFVPSGSGALVDTKTNTKQGMTYSAQVYGYDPAIDEVASLSTKENVRLNVFGSKSGDSAMCAIIDGSASSAWIDVSAGDESYGYSTCYATFQMRGYTNHVAQLFSYERVENVVYSKKMINKPISVRFVPLSGEDANYAGMAKVYRDYLINDFGMSANSEDVALSIRMLGGTELTKSFIGIPYKTVYPTTTLDSAKKIIEEIKNEIGNDFTVQLKGFGESGVDIGKVAGSYNVSKKLGSLEKLEDLFEYSKANNIDLYFDFDIERFNKNSFGISKFFGSITNAGEQKAIQYYYDVAVRDKKTETAYNLLSPAKFNAVFDKINAKINKHNIGGVSLDTLSSVAYSDYIDKEDSTYYSKNGFSDAAINVIKTLKGSNKQFMASSANAYSAAFANIITEAPVTSDKNNIFKCDVPFYQMVFKGSVPLTVQSLNLAADSKLALLKAIESGSGLSYTVINSWDSAMIDTNLPYFYNSVFADVKDDICKNYKELSNYYEKISGAHIVKHTVYENGLRETVFDNGVHAYVNYTEATLDTPFGALASYEYLITE